MKIWLDADSLPRELRAFVVRRAVRYAIKVVFVANREIDAGEDGDAATETSAGYEMVVCEKSPDAADDYIAAHVEPFDMVVTRDIPLAARLAKNGICVLNDRGTSYTKESAEKKLHDRNWNLMLAKIGFSGAAGKSYGKKEFDAFAHCFEKELMRLVRDETHSRLSTD